MNQPQKQPQAAPDPVPPVRTKPIELARRIQGACRGCWEWEGQVYTGAGVLVPQDVMRDDEELLIEGKEIAADETVLEMVRTMPEEALPKGYTFAPVVSKKAS